jgi:hypothetical protein
VEERDVESERIERADGGVLVRQPDVDVERRLRRPPEQAPQLVGDDLVPAALDEIGVAERCVGMEAAAEERRARGEGGGPETREVGDGVRRRPDGRRA